MARTKGAVGSTTKQNIEDAAVDLFAERGFDAVSLREIAERVGLQVGSLYNHITSKQDLYFGIVNEIWVDLLAELHETVTKQPTPIGQIRHMVKSVVEYHSRKGHKYGLFLRTNRPHLTVAQQNMIQQHEQEYLSRIEVILRRGDEEGVFHVVNYKVTSHVIIAMLREAIMALSGKSGLSAVEVEAYHSFYVYRILGAGSDICDAALSGKRISPERAVPIRLRRKVRGR